MTNKRYLGFIYIITGAAFWGITAALTQWLSSQVHFTVGWLSTVRLMVSGLVMLIILSRKINIWLIFKDKKSLLQVILIGILGNLGVQYTNMAAIGTGNAVTATLFQYLAPIIIAVFLAFQKKRMPTFIEMLALFIALCGMYLLITNGSINSLSLSVAGILWGIISAAALAFYTLYPKKFMKQWGSALTVGWGLFIGGFAEGLFNPPWQVKISEWSIPSLLALIFIIGFGTLAGYFLYLESLKFITPTETSILSCAEPLAATFVSVIWLHVSFGLFQLIGGFFIVVTVILLSVKPIKLRHPLRRKSNNVTHLEH
ncbi:DMT family transporter [Scopulibacillus cellulosilyticus]|uniref:DMT family transporter n=1 Tax=Scopulibacillus cellulosilyticus TaxID=2665665 RepID=A0ABW2PSB7_9BACL